MFCTLKANSGDGEPYASESTSPPFAKTRAGKLDKVACTNCRISKLRCSGGPGCCRRCCSKRLLCQYPSPPASSHSNTRIKAGQHRSKEPSAASAATARTLTPPATAQGKAISSVHDSLHDFGTFCLPSPDPRESATSVDGDMHSDSANELESLQWDQMQIHHPHQFMSTETAPENRRLHADLTTTDVSDFVFDSPLSFVGAKSTEHALLSTSSALTSAGTSTSLSWACSCMQDVMSANESVEILSWNQRDSPGDVYDVLQQQKTLLSKCENLLDCSDCISRPAYVMMVLSLCRKLLETLRMVTASRKSEGNHDGDGIALQPKRKRVASSDPNQRMIVPATRESSISTASSGGSLSGGQRDSDYSSSIMRERGLDDDDESLVLITLVKARVRALERVVGTVDDLVSHQNWPVHRGICRELRHMLESAFIT